MILKQFAVRFTLILLLSFAAFAAVAQPTLPDMAGTSENGHITLSWLCQFDGVKVITVMRSQDSLNDFEIIGYIKKPKKGSQEYTDHHAAPRKNFYKLSLVFNSGLTWRSNFIGVDAATPTEPTREQLPPRDTTKNIVLEKNNEQQPTKPPTSPIPNAQLESSFHTNNKPTTLPDTCKRSNKPGVSISFEADTTIQRKPEPPRAKAHIVFEEPSDNTPIFIKSKFIHTDSANGHVDIYLPDDVNTHHYSVKFYDLQSHLITDIPKINSAMIILDKRNFQRSGIYKFVLRKDYTELEAGYIKVKTNTTPNP